MKLSESEQVYVIGGIQEGIRHDGRRLDEYRPCDVYVDVLKGCIGSCRVKVANTDFVVGVKAEIGKPSCSTPKSGAIRFFIDISANAAPQFEGKGGGELAESYSALLSEAYMNAFDMHSLCLQPGELCWNVLVDVLILQIEGNVLDHISMAIKIALMRARLPVVNVKKNNENNQYEIVVPNDSGPEADTSMPVFERQCPCIATVHKVGWSNVLDLSDAESSCSKAYVYVACTSDGEVCLLQQQSTRAGSLDVDSLTSMLTLAQHSVKRLHLLANQHVTGDTDGDDMEHDQAN